MEIKKMNLANLKGIMSRQEMKNVNAGSNSDGSVGSGSGYVPKCPAAGTYTTCNSSTVCKTPEHPNSYCATTACMSGGSTSSFTSCNFYN